MPSRKCRAFEILSQAMHKNNETNENDFLWQHFTKEHVEKLQSEEIFIGCWFLEGHTQIYFQWPGLTLIWPTVSSVSTWCKRAYYGAFLLLCRKHFRKRQEFVNYMFRVWWPRFVNKSQGHVFHSFILYSSFNSFTCSKVPIPSRFPSFSYLIRKKMRESWWQGSLEGYRRGLYWDAETTESWWSVASEIIFQCV